MQFIDQDKLTETAKKHGFGSNDTQSLIKAAVDLSIEHWQYSLYAGNMAVRELWQKCPKSFSHAMKECKWSLSQQVLECISKYSEQLNQYIVRKRDLSHDIFGIKTLERSYLLRNPKGEIVETPQYLWMRVAIGIHGLNLPNVFKTYDYLSKKQFIHATPTLFNAGTNHPQMSSCFLVGMEDDSIQGIFNTLNKCAMISKYAGGIGLWCSNIRAKGTPIQGTQGTSNGIVPMLKVFNETARYVDQGGGKRMGSFAVYLEPWHLDIVEFLELKRNRGAEETHARDLFYALWIPDLFMKRVQNNEDWTLFSPTQAPKLLDSYGKQFEALYTEYEHHHCNAKKMKAQLLWTKILESQIETGTPYLLFKNHCNSKSNQKNLGVIKSSNLCAEIIQYSSPTETAVCNLASLALPSFLNQGEFDYVQLQLAVSTLVTNLNLIIDQNFYPTECSKRSNLRHRPVGIGVQGLADLFQLMRIPFDSAKAASLNKQIFETIYFAALSQSCEEAKNLHYTFPLLAHDPLYGQPGYQRKGAYSSFEGSPLSQGLFQFDLWNVQPSNRHDWSSLRQKIDRYGVRNSLLVSCMPTASTSQILGNNEAIEPFTSNLYSRRVLAGEYICINKHLVNHLSELNLWNDDIRTKLIQNKGSVQNISEIPKDVRKIYKTVWELKMKKIIEMAADRGAFIDQSQSLNLFIAKPNVAVLTSMHFFSWKKGLKTGIYYLRTKPVADAVQYTVEPQTTPKVCKRKIDCLSCGS